MTAHAILRSGHLDSLVELVNDEVSILIAPLAGADVERFTSLRHNVQILWQAPHTLVRPRSQDNRGDDETSFYDDYRGGLQEIFPNAGSRITHDGAVQPFHGEARLVGWSTHIDHSAPEQVSLVCTTALIRSPFDLSKTFTLRDNSSVLEIQALIHNRSTATRQVMWGFHPAFGRPFVDGPVTLHTEAQRVWTTAERFSQRQRYPSGLDARWPSDTGINFDRLLPPNSKTSDLLYLDFTPGWYVLANQAIGLAISMTWPKEIFGRLWLWQECHGTADWPWWGEEHIVAVEPHSSAPARGLSEAVRNGSALSVAPRSTVSARLTLGVHSIPQSYSGGLRVSPLGDRLMTQLQYDMDSKP